MQREQFERPLRPAERERIVETGSGTAGHVGDVLHMLVGAGSLAQPVKKPRVERAKHGRFVGDCLLEGFVVLNYPRQAKGCLRGR